MKPLKGRVAIVTGASRGIGVPIAMALARRGIRLTLAARSAELLQQTAASIRASTGAHVLAVPTDVTQPEAQDQLIAATLAEFGSIDVLINNAGIVQPAAYEGLALDELEQHLAVNLAAPMALARRVLPHLLAQNRGHIVNIASLGGLLGIAWGESYGATKHGLVGFTRSLRMSCKVSATQVSASVVCPGFIDEVGMYADTALPHGHRAPFVLGTSSPEAVAAAVIRAIERDEPEVIVSSRPVRALLMLGALSPRLLERLCIKLGLHSVFERTARSQGRGR
ncbi:MAG: SDR family NAD(P)-dependent oxidoreductase [Myxococcales bacterium]|nr:SDR family NAD(P)-dependent oxidoreductase [Myxococcales bacterium]